MKQKVFIQWVSESEFRDFEDAVKEKGALKAPFSLIHCKISHTPDRVGVIINLPLN